MAEIILIGSVAVIIFASFRKLYPLLWVPVALIFTLGFYWRELWLRS